MLCVFVRLYLMFYFFVLYVCFFFSEEDFMDAYRDMRSSIGLHEAGEVRNTFVLSTFAVKLCLSCMET